MATSGIQLRCGPEHWAQMDVTLSSTVTAGQMAKIQSTVGVYFEAGDSGDQVSFVYKADKIVVPKVAGSGLTIAQGAPVYFKAASAAVTGAASGNTLCGRCLVAAGASDTTVEIEFNGACAA